MLRRRARVTVRHALSQCLSCVIVCLGVPVVDFEGDCSAGMCFVSCLVSVVQQLGVPV